MCSNIITMIYVSDRNIKSQNKEAKMYPRGESEFRRIREAVHSTWRILQPWCKCIFLFVLCAIPIILICKTSSHNTTMCQIICWKYQTSNMDVSYNYHLIYFSMYIIMFTSIERYAVGANFLSRVMRKPVV